MARLLYACRFDAPKERDLGHLVGAYNDWLTRHYRDRRKLKDFGIDLGALEFVQPNIPDGHSIVRERYVSAKGEVIRLVWTYPVDDDPGLQWRNEVRMAATHETCPVEHLISVNSIDYRIVPTRLPLGSPSVIRALCTNDAVQIGDMAVKATAYPLRESGVDQFLALLKSDKRRLPIVLLSPYANGDCNEISSETLARRLAGVAVVVEVKDPEATWALSEEIGRSLACFDGAARIYWPGFSVNDDIRVHRLYLGKAIRAVGREVAEHSIEQSIFAVAAFRFAPDQRISDVVRDAEQAQRAQRIETQKQATGPDWETYAVELDEALTKANSLVAELEAENENLRANQKIIFSTASGESEVLTAKEELPEAPETVEDAVLYSQRTCAELIVLASAISAAKKSPFARPAEILAALEDLNEIAVEWAAQKKESGSGGDLLQYLKQRGWGKRSSMHISDTTRAKYGNSYRFKYGGTDQLFEPHITIGAGDANTCASIHFILDQTTGKIVIGHVGRHLPNTKT